MKRIFIITILAISSALCFGQTDSSKSTASVSVSPKSTLTLGTVYSNNASYYGERAEENTPYVAVAATYQLKSGIYFTGQSYKLLNDNSSTLSAAAIGAGVTLKMSKKLSTDISYSHSFYPSYSPLLQSANADNASINFSYNGWIKPTVNGDYAFGKTSDAFVTAGISKQINLFSITSKDIVTITPSANVVAGTQHFYQTYIQEKKLRDSLLDIITDPLFGSSGNNSQSKTVINTYFNLLSYSLKLPLAYNRAHYLVEAAYQLSLLSPQAQTGKGNLNSFLTFSFYYQF
ncbi:MAG TPA: hypothetical protein VMU83_13080 [Hanamia sp.]|nr:hypothetical protein [Hanamia sp.]